MDLIINEMLKAIPQFVGSLVLLGLAWLVGQRLTVGWNLRQKQKEYDLSTARDFHALYGEFFALWKLWNSYLNNRRANGLPENTGWDLLDRACVAEGKLESTLVRLACEKPLSNRDIEILGQFRQIYQMLRETMRADEPLRWNNANHPDYLAFKTLAPQVSSMIVGQVSRSSPSEPSEVLKEITANKWELRG